MITIISTFFALLIRIITFIIILVFVIPLQIKEAKIKNGLKVLRIQLLFFGITLFISNIFSISLVIDTIINKTFLSRPMSTFSQVINALSFLTLSIIGYLIYHAQYSEESKERHSKIDAMEKKSKLRARNK